MGNLIKCEWKKLFQWKFLLIFLPLVFLLNGILLSEQIARDMEEAENPENLRWTEAVRNPISYEEFLQGVETQAEGMQSAAVFNASYFNRKSLERTRAVYSRLHGIKPEPEYPTGMRYVTDYRLTDVLLIFSVAAVLIRLMLQERTEGLLHLLKPTKNGRGRLICAKYLTFAGVTFLLTIFLFGTNYVTVRVMDLLGNGDAAIQSLSGYLASPFPISVQVYFCLFLFCKWLAVTAAGSVFFLLCICCRNQVYAILCMVAAFAAELLICLTIENYSWLSSIRQFNLAAIIDTSYYFHDYINFNLMGIPVSTVTAGIVTVILVIVISLLLSVKLFASEASADAKKSRWSGLLQRRKSAPKIFASLFRVECKKMFFMQRGLFLLVVLFVVQAVSYWDSPFFSDKEEAYYQRYSQELSGQLSDAKSTWLKEEEARFAALETELEKQYQRYEQGKISAAVLDYYTEKLTPEQAELSGFERAKQQYQYLQDRAAKGEPVAYLYQTGWNQFLGPEGRRTELLDFAKLFLTMLLALSTLGTVEKSSSVELLIQPSAKGIKTVNRIKILLCSIYTVFAAVITLVWRPLQIADYYGLDGMHDSVWSLLLFSDVDWSVSLGIYVTLLYVLKAAAVILAGQFLFYLSRRCRQDSTVLFLGSVIFFVPIAAMWFYYGF